MNHYHAFITIIETGSFTKAAEQLGYTQSGISQLMKQLEEEVHTQLVIRSRRGITLTADGEKLYPAILQLVNAKASLNQAVNALEGLEQAVIKIGALDSIVNHYLPTWIQQFKTLYPDVQFHLTFGDYTEIEQMIKQEQIDFGFVNPEMTTELHMEPIVTDEYRVCFPINHHFAKHAIVDVQDLQREPYILIKDGFMNPIEEHLRQHHIALNVQYVVSVDRFAIEFIKKDLGISIMPALVIPQNELSIDSRPLSIPKARELHVAFKDFHTLSAAARAFITFMLKQNKNVPQ